jgi:hypothetical protein
MADEIIEELWGIKDALAKEADYDVDKLIELLQVRQKQRKENSNADMIDQQTGN